MAFRQLVVFCGTFVVAVTAFAGGAPAELVLTNAKIYTADSARSLASAVAVDVG